MTDFVKKKIVEKLAKFTKDLKPSDISLGFLSGKGELTNLELDCDFITDALQLPPWIRVSRAMCDTIRARVRFTNLRNEPIQIVIGTVDIQVSTTTDDTARTSHGNLLDQLGSNSPSKYGFTEKVIDGMKMEIRSIVINFHDPTYRVRMEITDVVIQSTTPQWQPATLSHTRYMVPEEDSVIIYKMGNIGSIKIEGWSVGGKEGRELSPTDDDESSRVKLRLIAGETNIRFTLKRHMEDCHVLHTRVVVRLGDVMWILSQSQLQALSRLIQTLISAAVRMAQTQREKKEALLGDDTESISGESVMSEEGSVRGAEGGRGSKSSQKKSDTKGKHHKKKAGLSQKEQAVKNRIQDYRSGRKNIPTHEIIQDSVHIQTGKIDLQFCDDSTEEERAEGEGEGEGGEEGDRPHSQPSTVEGSLLVRLKEVQVDVYLDQPAGQCKFHWNKANDHILRNVQWSEELIKKASKTQHMDLPSVSLQYLHERGIVVRCADFTVESLCNDTSSQESQLPLITCDKKTFNIPEDEHNPAFQVGMTLYFYPEAYGTKFLIPRPNVYIHCNPVHATLHQQSVLWISEFIHGVAATINLDLAMRVHTEGKAFLEERKAQSVPTHQLPGVDVAFKILFAKVTIPLPQPFTDGRPRALQLETASINIKNHSLDTLLQEPEFKSALESMDNGWVFSSHGSGEFPHFPGDFPCVPPWLRELLNYKLRNSRIGLVAELPSSPLKRSISPIVVQNSELMHTEAWHFYTSCVHLSFTKTDKYEDTLRPQDFVDDFPLHLWLFLPQPKRDGEESFTRGAAQFSSGGATRFSSSERGPTQGGGNFSRVGAPTGLSSPNSFGSAQQQSAPPTADNRPIISFIAYVSEPIRAKLERLQLLFLMRLKDSFQELKSAIMKFLTLTPDAAMEQSLKLMNPHTPRQFGAETGEGLVDERHREEGREQQREEGREQQREEGRDSSGAVGEDERGEEFGTVEDGGNVERGGGGVGPMGSPTSSNQSPNRNISASIGGCVIVRSIQADILLPSIFTSRTSKVSSPDQFTPGTFPPSLSPTSPLPPANTPDRLRTQSPSTPTRLTSPPRDSASLSPSLSPSLTHSLTHSQSQPQVHVQTRSYALTSKPNISGSESSLVSQTSQASSVSGQGSYYVSQVPVGLRHETGQTGSQTSLPAQLEGVERSNVAGDSAATALHASSSMEISPRQHLQVDGGHSRSLSASNIVPNFGKTTPTLGPSPLASISSIPDITVQSLQIETGTEIHPHSTSRRSSHRSLTDTEEGYILVNAPHTEQRGLDTRSEASEDLEVGREMRENSPCVPPPLVGEAEVAPVVGAEELSETVVEGGESGVEVGGGGGSDAGVRGGEQGVMEEGEEEGGGRERFPSYDRREMDDTLTPLTEISTPKIIPSLHRTNTTSSLRSTGSIKREKPPPLLRNEPEYILRISIGGIAALPNIQANEISLRASVSRVNLEEVRVCDSQQQRETGRQGEDSSGGSTPVIKARIEAGLQVGRFDLPPSTVNGKEQDAVVMLKISGLAAALLLKNAPVLKDFFDDEYEADTPVPIQIRIEDTSLMLRENLEYTSDTDSTLNVCIKAAEIHRGRKIAGTNLFTEEATDSSELSPELETLRLNPQDVVTLRELSPAAHDNDSTTSGASNPDLLQTFRSFIDVFESHVRRHGGLKVQLNQPEHIAGLLQDLQVSLSEEERKGERSKSSDAPPSYSETVGHSENGATPQARVGNASSASQARVVESSSPTHNRRLSVDSPTTKTRLAELRGLRQDSLELKRIQVENDDLISQLMQTKILLAERSQDLDEVTGECKKTKDELVTHKQVLENYQEHIERLLTENADLKMLTTNTQR